MENNNESTASKVDLTVVLDNKLDKQFYIVTQNDTQLSGNNVDSKKIQGIRVPLVLVNNRVLHPSQILRINILFKNLLPLIEIRVDDRDGQIQNNDIQGKNSSIKVVLITPVDGIYKKLKMEFYVTDTKCFLDVIEYKGIMKLLPFEKTLMECKGVLSTYDFVKTICEDTKMGMCVSPRCLDINDKFSRFFTSTSIKEALLEQIPMGGNGEAFFDCWVDGIGNVNLVNVKHIYDSCIEVTENTDGTIKGIKYGVNPQDLKIMCIVNDITNDTNADLILVLEVPRILTNINTLGYSNIAIEKTRWIVDNKSLYNNGSQRSYSTFGQDGANDDNFNEIGNYSSLLNEPSLDGVDITDYNFTKECYLGEEMGECSTLKSALDSRSFFERIRSKKLMIEMKYPNYGLTRGMVVGVMLVSNSINDKLNVHQQRNKSYSTANTSNSGDGQIDQSEMKAMYSENDSVIILKGLFYIDEITITYYGGIVRQILYTLPFSEQTCTNNKNTFTQL